MHSTPPRCLPAQPLPLQDIEALDEAVSAKQEHLQHLEAELASLQHSDLIVSAGGWVAGWLADGLGE